MARRRRGGRKTKMSEIMSKIAKGKRLTRKEREYLKRRR
ncbi:MAG: hypothetical protein EJNHJLOP_00011 [Methanophagales virus PBV082]|uniref:Uncharacterized protein n=1 Tax=Methanophagales virus PBV082 TaxID=3071307 RepID=A0AA46TE70_9VIRU|nr:MAG: hypothetical protein QIT52_gp11 [Methanophagales virus PBV082]UYL64900.1 MAG: hypothetical protein EJNHJLOP_00011 [Methanophagales virus PBV082]